MTLSAAIVTGKVRLNEPALSAAINKSVALSGGTLSSVINKGAALSGGTLSPAVVTDQVVLVPDTLFPQTVMVS